MKINLLTIGKNMPSWVVDGFQEYAKRMPNDFKINLTEFSLQKRTKTTSIEQIKSKEGEQILAAIPKGSYIVALDEHGKQWDTQQLAEQLQSWRENWQQICFLIGGPDGLSEECLQQAHCKWSLSKLTLPHPLVRVVLAEQLYRAWSVLAGHPYHRD